MSIVKDGDLLFRTYEAVKRNISRIPSQPLLSNATTFYRQIPSTMLTKPARGEAVSKSALDQFLRPRDGSTERGNRYSGPSPASLARGGPSRGGNILCCGGLYSSMQQQALVNEMSYYSHRTGRTAPDGQVVLTIRVRGSVLVADLSPHTSEAIPFLSTLGDKTFEKMNDPNDCSVARGIALAVAHSEIYKGLLVQTVRDSDRIRRGGAATT